MYTAIYIISTEKCRRTSKTAWDLSCGWLGVGINVCSDCRFSLFTAVTAGAHCSLQLWRWMDCGCSPSCSWQHWLIQSRWWGSGERSPTFWNPKPRVKISGATETFPSSSATREVNPDSLDPVSWCRRRETSDLRWISQMVSTPALLSDKRTVNSVCLRNSAWKVRDKC